MLFKKLWKATAKHLLRHYMMPVLWKLFAQKTAVFVMTITSPRKTKMKFF